MGVLPVTCSIRSQIDNKISKQNVQTYFVFASEFVISMSEMASIAFDTTLVLRKVLAEGRLVQIVELLPTRLLLLLLHDRHWHELGHGRQSGGSLDHLFLRLLLRILDQQNRMG